jgi:hypothetical protein
MESIVSQIANFIETYGGLPPSPLGRRAGMAQEIRDAFSTNYDDMDILIVSIAEYVRGWSDKPRNKYGLREQIAVDIENKVWEA